MTDPAPPPEDTESVTAEPTMTELTAEPSLAEPRTPEAKSVEFDVWLTSHSLRNLMGVSAAQVVSDLSRKVQQIAWRSVPSHTSERVPEGAVVV